MCVYIWFLFLYVCALLLSSIFPHSLLLLFFFFFFHSLYIFSSNHPLFSNLNMNNFLIE